MTSSFAKSFTTQAQVHGQRSVASGPVDERDPTICRNPSEGHDALLVGGSTFNVLIDFQVHALWQNKPEGFQQSEVPTGP